MEALGHGLQWTGEASFEARGGDSWLLRINGIVTTNAGNVRLEGERSFNLVQRYVVHANMKADPTGTGVGRTFIKNSMTLYKECDFRHVRLTAGDRAGGYVWARLGFVPSKTDWAVIKSQVIAKIEQIGDQIPPSAQRVLSSALNSADPRGIWAIARCQPQLPGDEYHIGKRLLVGTTWAGEFDLNDSDAWLQLMDTYGE